MTRFIKNLVLFGTILISYGGINYAINTILINTRPPKLNAKTIIMGDSHTMTAIDSRLLKSAQNISQTAEPYCVTYWKLKRLLKYNEIDTILLGYSFQNLSAFNDRKLSDSFWSDEVFDRIYSIISFDDLAPFDVNYMSYARAMVKNMLLYPKQMHEEYVGDFAERKVTLDTVHTNVQIAISRHYFENNKVLGESLHSIEYLDSIQDLSNKNNITLILINTPLHKQYRTLVPQQVLKFYETESKKLKRKNVLIVDYSTTELPTSDFADYDHLNAKGAQIFTGLIAKNKYKHNQY
jgi:hypothetical protein